MWIRLYKKHNYPKNRHLIIKRVKEINFQNMIVTCRMQKPTWQDLREIEMEIFFQAPYKLELHVHIYHPLIEVEDLKVKNKNEQTV